ncbi:MAG: HNH endonuclease [Thermoplasmata archaeon]|nr:HNH endonuclease [Thermoplasmata archaeon]
MGRFFYDKKGYPRWGNTKKLVHRTMAAKKVGGSLWGSSVVHHRDRNKKNFRPSNLSVMSQSKHSGLHAKKRRSKWW